MDKNKRQDVEDIEGASSKNKRQIYVAPENLEFFNSLGNKSGFINRLIKKYRQETEDNGANTRANR